MTLHTVAILGFGAEGQSAYRYFKKQKADITICDKNESLKLPSDVKAYLGSNYLQNLDTFDLIVRSPGIRLRDVKTTKPITSVTKIFFDKCPVPIIGVTGTKGKGTTATLITKILESAAQTVFLGGNIGRPALDFLSDIKQDDLVVLELSSFQLQDLTTSPHIAVMLMVEPDHLEYHETMAEYVAAKSNIFKYQHADDSAVFDINNKYSSDAVRLSVAQTKVPYGVNQQNKTGARIVDETIMIEDQKICSARSVGLLGQHNLENVMAAVAVTWPVVKDPRPIAQAIKNFTGLPHRLEFVAEVDGVKYYNDSQSTIPATTMAAIRAFKKPKIVILGGSDKKSDFSKLAELIAKSNVKHAIVIGDTDEKIITALHEARFDKITSGLTTMTRIVEQASQLAEKGDIVLLSPACASFGLFRDYIDRGDQFKDAVHTLQSSA